MKIFKEIFGRIWALWGLITFIATFLIFFLPSMSCYFFKDEWRGQKYFITVSKWWMNVWLFLVGCSVKVFGLQNFNKEENYVVTFNHNALLDVPLSAPYVPDANKTIAKASFSKVPIFGLFYSRGSVLVDRKKENSRVKSFEDMKTVLAKKMHMCIYPEGTRNRTAEPLKTFYDGAFKLAIDAKKNIMPCVLLGTKKAMPITKFFYLYPTKLQMHFLPPIFVSNLSVSEAKQQTFDVMKEFYVSNTK